MRKGACGSNKNEKFLGEGGMREKKNVKNVACACTPLTFFFCEILKHEDTKGAKDHEGDGNHERRNWS